MAGAAEKEIIIPPYFLADALALLDEKKEALDWLENALDSGFINYPFIAERYFFFFIPFPKTD